MNKTTRKSVEQKIENNRDELEDIAQSDLNSAWVAETLLEVCEK